MTDNLNLSLWVARRAEQGTLQAHSDYVVKQIAEYEAKLAEAAEALQGMVGLFSADNVLLKGTLLGMELTHARTTIAKLKESK